MIKKDFLLELNKFSLDSFRHQEYMVTLKKLIKQNLPLGKQYTDIGHLLREVESNHSECSKLDDAKLTQIDSISKLEKAISHSGYGLFVIQNKKCTYISTVCAELFGFPGKTIKLDELEEKISEVAKLGSFNRNHVRGHYQQVIQMKSKNHYKVSANIVGFKLLVEGQRTFIGSVMKLEEKTYLMSSKLEKEAKFEALVQNSYDVVGIFNKEGLIEYKTPSFERIFGYKLNEIIGTHCMDLIHPDDFDFVERIVKKVSEKPNKTIKNEARIRHADGRYLWCEVTITNLLHNEQINGLVVNYRDISQIKENQEEIEFLANHDYLTGLPNRRLFNNHLETELTKARLNQNLLALLYIDIDRFKIINDSIGQELGDQLLIEIADRLKKLFPSAFTARIGGDEFIVVLNKDIHKEKDAVKRAAEVINGIKSPIRVNHHTFYVTPSVGISMYPIHSTDTDQLVQAANNAMYDAKKRGKNSFHLYNGTNQKFSLEKFLLETDLRGAARRNEFYLLYQPKINLVTKKVIGVEALIRWKNQRLGVISPADFIPLAEESGIIVDIGEWVFKHVCLQIKEWEKQGIKPIPISVNLSLKQLQNNDIIDQVKRNLYSANLSPKWIEFEVTESAIMHDIEDVKYKLDQFKEMGLKIAIDDFGTGYTSIGYLKKLPIDTLKIDQSFIKNLSEDPDYLAIVTAIISLANSLHMNTVAEGIETAEQLSLLLERDCKEGQGYLFSKPILPFDLLNFNRFKEETSQIFL